MNRLPKTGKTILSKDRYVIKKISLNDDERERLKTIDKEEILHPYIEGALPETNQILEELEERKRLFESEEEPKPKRFRT